MSEPITPGGDFLYSPSEIDASGAADFASECELLIATTMNPVVASGNNYSAQDPATARTEATSNMAWTDIPSYTAYSSDYHAHIHDLYSGGIALVDPRVYDANYTPFYSESGVVPVLFPPRPIHVNHAWQVSIAQYSLWLYLPNYQTVFGTDYWSNAVYAHRARFRANRRLVVWQGAADLYTDNPATTYFIWPDNATQTAPKSYLAADTWKEIAIPAAATPNLGTGFIGRIAFAVYSESEDDWETRSGLTLG